MKWTALAMMVRVIGDKKVGEFNGISTSVFSPDGKKVAYVAVKGDEVWWKVIDEK